jgi:pimeloyl-ACP methyl ester carboxylesterase
MFKHQIRGLSDHYTVVAMDMRGHGESDKPRHGYNVYRMAEDLREFILAQGIEDAFVLGHSMGVKVIWAHIELHGTERMAKLVLADDSPSLLDNPTWSVKDRSEVGPMFTFEALNHVALQLVGADSHRVTHALLQKMFTPSYRERAPEEFEWVVVENLKMPRDRAVQLLFANAATDWREVIKRIDVPTLVMGGELSTHRIEVIRWEASQIKGAKLKIWSAAERGSHFVFLENPQAFNSAVVEFLGKG